jgi:hypothetical protein
MRRLHGALTALMLAAIGAPAGAAEISRVVTSGEPRNPFGMDIDVRWDRSVESATITRERGSAATASIPGGAVFQGDRLQYTRNRNAVVPRVAVGLWRDLELHAELPYVLGDDREWRYGGLYGSVAGPGGPYDSISTNTIDAQGQPCAVIPCPLFPVAPSTAGYHGGMAGDLKIGLAWAVFNDKKDDTKPTWVVGMDVTAPTAAKWEPGKNRTTDTWESPFRVKTNPGPIGEKIWKWDLYTVLSKRYKYADPYVKAHAQLAFKSASTYSNCDAVNDATSPALEAQQMNSDAGPRTNRFADAANNCASWGSDAGAQLPFVAGIIFGTELVPYEDVGEGQKVTLDFRFFSDLTTKQRFYNELTDATGKLLQTGEYLEFGGLAGLYVRASRWVQLRAQASIATRTAHDLTGESLGKNGSWPALNPDGSGRTADPTQMNPNFDWRWDAPGRRFRISEVSVFELSFGAALMF